MPLKKIVPPTFCHAFGLPSVLLASLSILLVSAQSGQGQERFQLVVPNSSLPASQAEIDDQRLIIRDGSGSISRYERDRRMDSEDGMFAGYVSRTARQVIRWPLSNEGPMQIGSLDGPGRILFRPSKMSVVATGRLPDPARDRVLPNPLGLGGENRDRNANLGPLDDFKQPIPVRLAHRADQQQFLSLLPEGNVGLLGPNANQGLDWTMVPIGGGLVRLQGIHAGHPVALRCDPRNRRLSIARISGDASQLWRWNACPRSIGGYLLESVLFPGQALANQGGQLLLQPMGFGIAQQWFPIYQNVLPYDPVYRTVSNRVVPNPPLEPAQVNLVNNHSEALFVILADRRASGQMETIRIPAGQSHRVTLDRDSGSNIVETHEVMSLGGLWDRQEFTIPVPPAVLYDISVYEEFLQSIAIDRTGKSPNPVEDINYQPKSIGWFIVPPGPALAASESIDLFAQGKAARNPGGVRPIDRELLEKKKLPSEDPLRAILKDFQVQRGAF